ncbi:folate-binding protein YgfZ [Phenylobacterium sp.]|uniref:CAF17-like 4Fe-4S cluster assembly/insertion protein YgfZ n=1 Tax=Phenylobacterium sp. TaxID=1871053 RepID=UPI0028117CBE|nr:folate-binding protein YgfZ [Phenylobacterium sp.]
MTVAQLNSRAVIAVGGPDWRTFLQGLLTQDVETLRPGEARFGALLTPQGRLLYDLFLVGADEGCLLDVAAEHRDALLQRLTLYRLRAKVDLAASEAKVFAAFPASDGIVDPRLPELGARIYGEGAGDADETAYEAHRLALGVPGPADWGSDKTYPIEANFDLLGGIDFKKGCFVGQETTSRMKRRGQVKSRMLPITFEGAPPPPGTEILAGELRAGEVLSGVDGRAMALVRLDRALGAPLTVGDRSAQVETPAWFPQTAGDNAA